MAERPGRVGFVTYDGATERFSLSPEQAAVFAHVDGPACMAGGYSSLSAMFSGLDRLKAAFRTGDGIGWGDHSSCLFCGTERFYRTGYSAYLVADWLPALEGVVDKLTAGARVIDIGCGHGASTRIMAETFPTSKFLGVDLHSASIDHARAHAGGLPNLHFEVASAQDFDGRGFDLATMFDAYHDMGDPVGAARQVRGALNADGTFMLVEPMAGDSLADNLHPVGRLFYACSAQLCVPAALSQAGGESLGAQAGEVRIAAGLHAAGFSRVLRAAETPFNMILEARV